MKNKKYGTLTKNEIRFVTDIVILWKVSLDGLRSEQRHEANSEWLRGKISAVKQLYKWTKISLDIDPKQFRAIWLSVAS
jgi:hypothetical protein